MIMRMVMAEVPTVAIMMMKMTIMAGAREVEEVKIILLQAVGHEEDLVLWVLKELDN